jgi:hypothetical protein
VEPSARFALPWLEAWSAGRVRDGADDPFTP